MNWYAFSKFSEKDSSVHVCFAFRPLENQILFTFRSLNGGARTKLSPPTMFRRGESTTMRSEGEKQLEEVHVHLLVLGVGAEVPERGVVGNVRRWVGVGRQRWGCSGDAGCWTLSAWASVGCGEGFGGVQSDNVRRGWAGHNERELAGINGRQRRGKWGSRDSGSPGSLLIG